MCSTTNRFEWQGEDGNWTYEEIDSRTGRLILTYDEDGNDPGAYYELMRLTFMSATSGI